MAKIVDPDQLNQATEVTFAAPGKTIDLAIAGNLDDNAPGRSSGVTHQALYSFTKEEWLATSGLQPLRFPFDPIFEAKFDWINDWQPNDAQSIDLIRDGGFKINLLDDEYMVIISLQDFDSTADQAYYHNDSTLRFSGTRNDFDKTGELNEPVLIFDGTTDNRDFFKAFNRIQGKTHGYADLVVDQDTPLLTYQAYRIPLSNVTDGQITETDGNIDTISPYTEIQLSFLLGSGFTTWADSIVYPAGAVVLDAILQASGSSNGTWWFTPAGGTSSGTGTADDVGVTDWESYTGEEQIGVEWFAYNRIIDLTAGTATKEEFYNWGERQLRLTTTINADAIGTPNQDGFGTVDGEFAMELFEPFDGNTLKTKPGVLLRDYNANDTNAIELNDITVDGGGLTVDSVAVTSTTRLYPSVAAGEIEFDDKLVAQPDVDTIYKMFFQYTQFDAQTDFTLTGASGNTATFNSPTLDLTTFYSNSDYCELVGFLTNTVNNGTFQVSSVLAGSMTITKVNGETLVNDALGDSVTVRTDPYDTPDAVIVNDNSATPITGTITAASIAFDFAYSTNVQGGRTSGVDAPVAVMAMAKDGAQWIDGLFTITNTAGLKFQLNSATERVYSNP